MVQKLLAMGKFMEASILQKKSANLLVMDVPKYQEHKQCTHLMPLLLLAATFWNIRLRMHLFSIEDLSAYLPLQEQVFEGEFLLLLPILIVLLTICQRFFSIKNVQPHHGNIQNSAQRSNFSLLLTLTPWKQ